jgi:hypothetical protein
MTTHPGRVGTIAPTKELSRRYLVQIKSVVASIGQNGQPSGRSLDEIRRQWLAPDTVITIALPFREGPRRKIK